MHAKKRQKEQLFLLRCSWYIDIFILVTISWVEPSCLWPVGWSIGLWLNQNQTSRLVGYERRLNSRLVQLLVHKVCVTVHKASVSRLGDQISTHLMRNSFFCNMLLTWFYLSKILTFNSHLNTHLNNHLNSRFLFKKKRKRKRILIMSTK